MRQRIASMRLIAPPPASSARIEASMLRKLRSAAGAVADSLIDLLQPSEPERPMPMGDVPPEVIAQWLIEKHTDRQRDQRRQRRRRGIGARNVSADRR